MERLAEAAKGIFNSFTVTKDSPTLLIMKKLKHGVYITATLRVKDRKPLEDYFDLSIEAGIKQILHALSTADYVMSILKPDTINEYTRNAEKEAVNAAKVYCAMNNAPLCMDLPRYLELYGFNQFILDIHGRRIDRTIFIWVNGQLFMLYQSDDDTIQITHDAKSEKFTHPNIHYKIINYLSENANPPPPPPLNQQLLCTLDRIVTNLITHDGATR